MSNRRTFAKQLDHFVARRRIAVDMRGHGESDKPEIGYSIPALAEDLSRVCAELDLSRPVVIGHSLGGAVALQYAATRPNGVAALVILDSPIVMPPEFAAGVAQLAAAARSPAYEEAINGFMGQFAGFEDRPDERRAILDDVAATPRHVVAACLESTAEFDSEAAASACKAPLLYVSSGPWFTNPDRLREICPQLITGQTVGSGHYHQLEVPDQVNAMIDRFLEMNGL